MLVKKNSLALLHPFVLLRKAIAGPQRETEREGGGLEKSTFRLIFKKSYHQGVFEFSHPDPQLVQIFKPTRNLPGGFFMYTYVYIKKKSWQIFCGFKNLDTLGVRMRKFKNTMLVGFFKNQSKS